jgi:hypothetical protein
MARGDVHFFAAYLLKSKSGTAFNLASDTIKLGIVNNTIVPTVSTADPRWGTGGSTDLSVNQVGLATGYTGPVTLTGQTYTQASGVDTFKANNVTIAQDASGFSTGYYGILYDATVAGNFAIGFVDLGGPVGNVNGPLNINWNASGIFQETAA